MFLSLWHYLQGYVIVEVRGFAMERFINLTVNNHIVIWDVQSKGQCIYFKIGVKDFKRLKPYVKKARCRLQIIEKKGFPFIAFRYRRRRLFEGGVLVFVAILWLLSSFVWLVEVEGAERISSMDIITSLEEQGYGVGKWKGSLNLREAEAYLSRAYPDLVWSGIKFEGTRLLVQVSETVEAPDMMMDTGIPTSIVAKRDALITYIATYKGNPLVKKGDTVKKGEVLVAGEMPMGVEEGAGTYYTDSKAKIRGKTVYASAGEIDLRQVKKAYTDETSKKYTLKLFNKSFTLFNQKIPFETYDKLITRHQLRITKLFPLPFAFEVETRVAYTPCYKDLTEEEAKDFLLSELWEEISQNLSEHANILKREAFFKKTGNAISGTLQVVAEEDIGYKVEIEALQNEKAPSEGEMMR